MKFKSNDGGEKLKLRETQKISLDILKTIASICEKNSIRYYLMFGTLLGAIRHKGFIPWDDDIDIMMPRPDYEKFCMYFKEHESEHAHLRLFNSENCLEYPYMIARVSDDRYKIVMDNEKPYGMGVFVDIYPYDGMGNTWKEAISGWRKGVLLSSLCFQATRKKFKIGHTKLFLMKIVKFPFYIISKIIGRDFFQKRLRQITRKPYDDSKYIGNLIWGTYDVIEIYDRELFKESVYIDFEGERFRAPNRFNDILTKLYGNYMKLPPEKDRIPHHDYYVEKI